MKHNSRGPARSSAHWFAALALLLTCASAQAGGGYYLLGYGPLAHQAGGTSTAMGLDGFMGSSNPGKLAFVGNRLDLDLLAFSPSRTIERTGSGTLYDFSSSSKNSFYLLPEAGYARKLDERFSLGLTLYGNGGLNTEYHDDTGIPDTNLNPARCGNAPGNFLFGCGKLGFDLAQVIIAPTASWQYRPGQSLGISALLAYQRIKVYGFQAFEAVSAHPDAVSNRGYDNSFGAGVRIGWFARPLPWLDVGAAYSTKLYMEAFDKYRGLLADEGNFDIPRNLSVGVAIRPAKDWELGFDLQRIFWGDIRALSNGVQQPGGPEQAAGQQGRQRFQLARSQRLSRRDFLRGHTATDAARRSGLRQTPV